MKIDGALLQVWEVKQLKAHNKLGILIGLFQAIKTKMKKSKEGKKKKKKVDI